jgi:hypothetical protein
MISIFCAPIPLACGKLPDTGSDLCSQPTLSRLENAPSLKDAIRLTWALVDQWMVSYEREPASFTPLAMSCMPAYSGHEYEDGGGDLRFSISHLRKNMRQQRPRLYFIDVLRGLAILGVLAIHTGQTVPHLPPILVSMTNFGSLGVQLFFMLSSLTLSSIYSPVSFSPADFYLRRFFRIAPAFYLAGLFYTLSSPLAARRT